MIPFDATSGNVAYRLFMSDDNKPLHNWISKIRLDLQICPEYIIAVCNAYNNMLVRCRDYRYGKVREE